MAGGDATRTVVVVVVAGDPVWSQATPAACHPDLGLVDALARLQVAARRLGCSVHLRQVSDELTGLLDLVGLGVAVGAPELALEARGEAEEREQLGVQEVVPLDDPPV